MTLSPEQITEYLKWASKLEASLYSQRQFMEDAKKEFDAARPKKAELPSPEAPEKPVRAKDDIWEIDNHRVAAIVFFSAAAPFVVGGLYGKLMEAFVLGFLLAIVGICFLCAAKIAKKRVRTQNEYAYQEALDEYNQAMKDYKAECEKVKLRQMGRNQDYYEAYGIVEANCDKTLAKLEELYQDTETVLSDFYSKEVLFGKYQDLFAVTTLYEYFALGRCNELTGPFGAYNLYEHELETGKIIGDYSKLSGRLPEIRRSQYTLYSEITKNDEAKSKLCSAIRFLAVLEDDEFLRTPELEAYCALIADQNAQAKDALKLFD